MADFVAEGDEVEFYACVLEGEEGVFDVCAESCWSMLVQVISILLKI